MLVLGTGLADIAVSVWTVTEFASAMGVRTRMGTLDTATAADFDRAARLALRDAGLKGSELGGVEGAKQHCRH